MVAGREAPGGSHRAARAARRGRTGARRVAARRRRQGRHHAAHGLLPRRLDAPGPRGAGPAHAPVGARARAPARRPQGRARGGRPVHGPRRPREARGRRARLPRLLRVEPARVGVAHPLRARAATRTSGRSTPPRPRPAPPPTRSASTGSSTPRRPTRSCTRSSCARSRRRCAARTRTAARAQAGWGLAEIHGLTQNRSIEAHLADHGISRERGERLGGPGPGGRGPHDRPPGERAARGQARPRAARADRRLVHLRRPRHGHEVELPVLQPGPPRLGAPGLRAARAPRRARAAAAARAERLRQLERGRPVRRPRPRRPGGVRLRGARRGGGDGARLAARRDRPDADPRARRALDAHLLLRPGHRGRQRGGLPDDRLPVPHRLGGGARPAVRRDARAVRGHAQPPADPGPGPQDGHPARPVDRAEGGAAHRAARRATA